VEREHATDPARRAAVERTREALALWADDARRQAAEVDPDALARAILSGRAPAPPVERVPWGWAAAAVLLLGVGVAGLSFAHPVSDHPNPAVVTADLENAPLDVLRMAEIDGFTPALDRTGGR
jgi:hypothetical protein